jgi:UDP-N-acetylmuramate-alanine ligase
VQIIIGHGQYEVQEDDFVIYVDVPSIIDGPELTRSRALQASETKHYHMAMSYNQFVAELSKHMRTMCITGTNGKSSTTALAITA